MHRFIFAFVIFVTPARLIAGHCTEQKSVLVVGGAGYIGSYVNEKLYQAGYNTLVLDNLELGDRENVVHGTLIQGNMADADLLDQLFSTHKIDAVMHFAAFKDVGESVREPIKYYVNNVSNTLKLLDCMVRHNVKVFVFSSSAAIFGLPEKPLVDEEHPAHPMSPYGRSKLMVEAILKDIDEAHQLKYSCLRYFNAAGSDPTGLIACKQDRSHNLIPVVLRAIQNNKPVTIFGTDYETRDGTCVRDYIHIEDLASAHIAALEALLTGAGSSCYNLGNGNGFTVREVVAAAEAVTGHKVNSIEGSRRPGDPAVIVAASTKAKKELSWQPLYPTLESMIQHTWKVMQHDPEIFPFSSKSAGG